MVKINLITNAGRKTLIVPETKTLEEIYIENDVNYDSCTNTVDSVPLRPGDIHKTLAEMGVGDTVRMSSIVKMDNAAKLVIAGSACIVKSAVKLEDWNKVLKYDPAFGLYNEDDEPEFMVAVDKTGTTAGSMNDNGITFSGTPDAEGYGIVTTVISPDVTDKVTAVTEKFGNGILKLNQVEAGVDDALKTANEHEAEIKKAIELM